jgi:hypothetical protein
VAQHAGTPASNSGRSVSPNCACVVPNVPNRVAYLFLYINAEGIPDSVSNFAGVTPELVSNAPFGGYYIYRVINPAVGATTFAATLPAEELWSAHVVFAQDVNTASPNGAPVSNTNDQTDVISATVPSAVGGLALAFGFMVTDNIVAAEGSTLSSAEEAIDTGFRTTAVAYEAGAESVTIGFSSLGPSGGDNYIIAIPVNNAITATPTITDAGDESFRVGEVGVAITCTNAGATQGTGRVRICPTDNIADVNGVNQTVTAWGDTSITIDIVASNLPRNTNLYLFIENDGGQSNAPGRVVQITPPPAVLAWQLLN